MFRERIKKIYFHRRTLWDMAISQFMARYAGSRLGIWWSVLTPLILAVSINFVFEAAFRVDIPNYTLFVLAGIMPWFFFTSTLTQGADSFLPGSRILKQAILPLESVPVSFILANLFNFLIGLIFLLPVFVITNLKVIIFLPILFIVIVLHLFFILGLSFVLAYVNTLFRDLSHLLSIVFMIWFWITPVFYSLEMIAFPLRWVCLFNPMTYYIILYRDILFYAQVPGLVNISAALIFSLASAFMGYYVLLKKEALLLKRI